MFSFAWPYIFLLLPLFWVVVHYFPQQNKKNEAMLRVPFLARIESLKSFSSRIKFNGINYVLALLIWVLLILACANPQWLGAPLSITQAGRNIMLAIDVSPSMEIPDLVRHNQNVNRLQTVKAVALPFIEKRYGDKLGLILFGSKAYLQTPLTLDRKTVRNMLDDASIGLAGERTAIGDAVALAVKKFNSEDAKSRILILLTDGGNNSGVIDPNEAAELAKENHIKIYTVGIGASQMVVSGFFGQQLINPSADLDEGLLKKIASITGGQYFRAQDEKTLTNILDAINDLEPVNSEVHHMRPISALFYWPLMAALMLLIILLYPNYLRRD